VLGSGTLPPMAGTQIRALRVNIVMHEGRGEFRLTAVVSPTGGASIVSTTATSGTAAASDTTTAGAGTSNAATPAVAPVTPALRLNYPFTLLEIQENAEMSPAPPAA